MSVWTDIKALLSSSNGTTQDKSASKTRRVAQDYPVVDYTEKIVADTITTKGLYYNTLNGYKLAGVFAKNIIDTPIAFCGSPSPQTDDEDILEFMKPYNPDLVKVLRQSHREGTVWIWPWYDSKEGKVKLRFIQDNWRTETFIDPERDTLDSIITTRNINVLNSSGDTVSVKEKITYTKTKITTIYDSVLKSSTRRNILGILPIGFTNMADGGEFTGHSDFTNILPDLMDYHRTALSMSIALNDFRTKLVQTIEGDPDTWAENQGFNDLDDFMTNSSPEKAAMIFNTAGGVGSDGDKTEFITAKGLVDSNIAAMKISYKKIVQGCRVPELFWGLKQEGNHATAEEAMTSLINLVQEKRIQATANFELLINSMIRLDYMSRGQIFTEELSIIWNQLDAVSDVSRSEIFKNFCDGIAKVWTSGVITIKQAYDLWTDNYPKVTSITEKEFETGLIKTIALLQKAKSPYEQNLGDNPLDSL